MGIFENLPYTNFHELNLEWIVNKLNNLEEPTEAADRAEAAAAAAVISAGDAHDEAIAAAQSAADAAVAVSGYMPKTGGVFTGAIQGEAAGTQSGKFFLLPYLTNSDFGLQTTDPVIDFYTALIKWVCSTYPNVQQGLWLGVVTPSSKDICMVEVYNTASLDLNGMPSYATCWAFRIDGTIHAFDVLNYVITEKTITGT